MENEFMTVLAMLVLMFIMIRWLFLGIIDFRLNKKTRKERKKRLTFKEWLLYSRYRTEIPGLLLYLYFGVLISHILFLILIPIWFHFFIAYYHIINIVAKAFVWTDLFILAAINFAFRGRKDGKTFLNVGRWFKEGKH